MDIEVVSDKMLPEEWQPFAADIENYTQKFLSFSKASTESTIAMCEVLHQAKSVLNKDDLPWETPFDLLCKRIGYPRSKSGLAPAVKKYLRIGACADRFRPYLDRLPNSWTTLYEITQLDPDKFEELVDAGKISSQTTGSKLKALLDESNEEKIPAPSVTIVCDESISSESFTALCKEIEALRINFKMTMRLNRVAKDMLPKDGTNYG